jgi:hypothetical protein
MRNNCFHYDLDLSIEDLHFSFSFLGCKLTVNLFNIEIIEYFYFPIELSVVGDFDFNT